MEKHDELALFETLVDQTKTAVEESDKARGEGNWCYLDQGTYVLRLYPDLHKGRLRLMRKLWGRRPPGIGRFLYDESDSRMNKLIKRLHDAKVENSFLYEAQEYGVIRAFVISTTENNEYLKLGEPFHLVMSRWAMIDAFERWVSEIKPSDLRDLIMEPEAHGIKIEVYKEGKKWKCNISLSQEKYKKADLPDDFPPLDSIFIDEVNPRVLTEDDYKKMANGVEELIQKNGQAKSTTVLDPKSEKKLDALSDDLDNSPPKTTRTEPVKEPTPEKSTTASTTAAHTCPSGDPDLTYGEHPSEPNPACLSCAIESHCLRETFRRKKAQQ